MAKYKCPICGYQTMFGSPAQAMLHNTVSHGDNEPIVEVTK